MLQALKLLKLFKAWKERAKNPQPNSRSVDNFQILKERKAKIGAVSVWTAHWFFSAKKRDGQSMEKLWKTCKHVSHNFATLCPH